MAITNLTVLTKAKSNLKSVKKPNNFGTNNQIYNTPEGQNRNKTRKVPQNYNNPEGQNNIYSKPEGQNNIYSTPEGKSRNGPLEVVDYVTPKDIQKSNTSDETSPTPPIYAKIPFGFDKPNDNDCKYLENLSDKTNILRDNKLFSIFVLFKSIVDNKKGNYILDKDVEEIFSTYGSQNRNFLLEHGHNLGEFLHMDCRGICDKTDSRNENIDGTIITKGHLCDFLVITTNYIKNSNLTKEIPHKIESATTYNQVVDYINTIINHFNIEDKQKSNKNLCLNKSKKKIKDFYEKSYKTLKKRDDGRFNIFYQLFDFFVSGIKSKNYKLSKLKKILKKLNENEDYIHIFRKGIINVHNSNKNFFQEIAQNMGKQLHTENCDGPCDEYQENEELNILGLNQLQNKDICDFIKNTFKEIKNKNFDTKDYIYLLPVAKNFTNNKLYKKKVSHTIDKHQNLLFANLSRQDNVIITHIVDFINILIKKTNSSGSFNIYENLDLNSNILKKIITQLNNPKIDKPKTKKNTERKKTKLSKNVDPSFRVLANALELKNENSNQNNTPDLQPDTSFKNNNYSTNFAVIMGPSASGKTFYAQNTLMKYLNNTNEQCDEIYSIDGGDLREVSAIYNAAISKYEKTYSKLKFKKHMRSHLLKLLINKIIQTIKERINANYQFEGTDILTDIISKSSLDKSYDNMLSYLNKLNNYNLKVALHNSEVILGINTITKSEKLKLVMYYKYQPLFNRILLLEEAGELQNIPIKVDTIDFFRNITAMKKKAEDPKCSEKIYTSKLLNLNICSDKLCTDQHCETIDKILEKKQKYKNTDEYELLEHKQNIQLINQATKLPLKISKLDQKYKNKKKKFTVALVETFADRLCTTDKPIRKCNKIINNEIHSYKNKFLKVDKLILCLVLSPKKICKVKGSSRSICEGKPYSSRAYQRAIDIGYGQIKTALQSSKPITTKCYIDLNMGTADKMPDQNKYIYSYKQMIKSNSCGSQTCSECDRNIEVKYIEKPISFQVDKNLIDDLESYLEQFNSQNQISRKLNLLDQIQNLFNEINKNLKEFEKYNL